MIATIHFSFVTANWLGQAFIIAVGVFVANMLWGMLEVNIVSSRRKRQDRDVVARLDDLTAAVDGLVEQRAQMPPAASPPP